MNVEISELTQKIQKFMIENNLTVSTAESLTGGMLASAFVDNTGSSAFFNGGIVAYQDRIKNEVLCVSYNILNDPERGTVSEDCARWMAENARSVFHSDWGLSTTGFAGPSGEPGKPVGLVYMGITNGSRSTVISRIFNGDRKTIREAVVLYILKQFCEELGVNNV